MQTRLARLEAKLAEQATGQDRRIFVAWPDGRYTVGGQDVTEAEFEAAKASGAVVLTVVYDRKGSARCKAD